MKDGEKEELIRMTVASYIQKATALIGVPRKVGGNQFRHMMATFAILIDYHYTNHVLLKASLIHDLFEDVTETDRDSITRLDHDGFKVVALVDEVTRRPQETKIAYLEKILKNKGYTDKNWITKEFPGENHSEKAWCKRFEIPVLFLLGK